MVFSPEECMKLKNRTLVNATLAAVALLSTILFSACARTNASSPVPPISKYNACSGVTENQKEIERLESQIKDLNAKMNDANRKDLTAEIANLKKQIDGINQSNAVEMQNCQPQNVNNPGSK